MQAVVVPVVSLIDESTVEVVMHVVVVTKVVGRIDPTS